MRVFALTVWFVLLAGCISGQEIRVLEGRKYLVHHVKAGETLYAISRHYAVSPADLKAANPASVSGLSIGQTLLVPQDAMVKKDLKTAPKLLADELAHTVGRKETIYGLTKRYGVEQEALIKRNPEIAQGLKEGMVVIIPVSKVSGVDPEQLAPATADGAVLHEVKAGETYYALGQQYGVTREEIERANGGLPDGLKDGITVRIPVPKVDATPRPIAADSMVRKQRYRVGYLLPFSLARNDSLMADPENRELDDYTRIAAQFWAGSLMAIDSVRAHGLNADVEVYDTGTDAAVWSALWKRPGMRETDLFIGPFHRTAIEELTRSVRNAHIVCPVQQSNKVLLGHPNVSKVVSSRTDQMQELMQYVAAHNAGDNMIFCRPEIPAEKDLQDQAYRSLGEALAVRRGGVYDSVPVARPARRDIADLKTRLVLSGLNVIVLPSEDVELVANTIGQLAALTPKYNIRLYGLNSWLNMETIDPADMDKLNVHVPAETWIDLNDPRVVAFIEAYRERFHTEPDEYAFRGYDVTTYYLTALLERGNMFPDHFGDVRTRPLQMEMDMVRAGTENGWRNKRSLILQVKDMQIRRADP